MKRLRWWHVTVLVASRLGLCLVAALIGMAPGEFALGAAAHKALADGPLGPDRSVV